MLRLKQAGLIAAGLIVATVMALLGLWQMDTYRHTGQQVAIDRTQMDVVPLASSIAADGSVADIYARRVSLSGRYRPELQLWIGQDWPLRVLTAFELDDGRLVGVVRGAAEKDPAPPPPTGRHELVGVFLASDAASAGEVAAGVPADALPTVRLARIAQLWQGTLVPGYVTLSADDATKQGLQAPMLPLPEVKGSAQNSGYALQWWVFAAAALGVSIWSAHNLAKKAPSERDRDD